MNLCVYYIDDLTYIYMVNRWQCVRSPIRLLVYYRSHLIGVHPSLCEIVNIGVYKP
jgi:hypothetical protein